MLDNTEASKYFAKRRRTELPTLVLQLKMQTSAVIQPMIMN